MSMSQKLVRTNGERRIRKPPLRVLIYYTVVGLSLIGQT